MVHAAGPYWPIVIMVLHARPHFPTLSIWQICSMRQWSSSFKTSSQLHQLSATASVWPDASRMFKRTGCWGVPADNGTKPRSSWFLLVTHALRKLRRFVFIEEGEKWRQCNTGDLSAEDSEAAHCSWKEADALELADDEDGDETAPAKDRLCHPTEGGALVDHRGLSSTIRKRTDDHTRLRLKWTHRELHDIPRIAVELESFQ